MFPPQDEQRLQAADVAGQPVENIILPSLSHFLAGMMQTAGGGEVCSVLFAPVVTLSL